MKRHRGRDLSERVVTPVLGERQLLTSVQKMMSVNRASMRDRSCQSTSQRGWIGELVALRRRVGCRGGHVLLTGEGTIREFSPPLPFRGAGAANASALGVRATTAAERSMSVARLRLRLLH